MRSENAEPCAQHSRVLALDEAVGEGDVAVGAGVADGVHLAVRSSTTAIGHAVDVHAQRRCPAPDREIGTFCAVMRILAVGDRGKSTVRASSASIASTSSVSRSSIPIFCDDLGEESEHDEASRLVLGDAARLQVEQLLVVEPTGGARVAGAEDVAGLDLEVRDRVGARPFGEDEVAVRLVRVGARGIRCR